MTIEGRLKMAANLGALFALVSMQIELSDQLRFTSVQIPSLVQMSSNFWLSCSYEHQDQQLYSVHWYKDNVEFYRLTWLPMVSGETVTGDSSDEYTTIGRGEHQQKRHFGQAGVNVMMGASNATHVRLLNASLETEGQFACEISTQNLSSIRYEKDIRVYALGENQLRIIGFRDRYSLNEPVDLLCNADFSRPKAALGWFINDKLVSRQDSRFELELLSERKFNEPHLQSANLRLKFKLTTDLLVTYALVAAGWPNSNQRANQSQHHESALSLKSAARNLSFQQTGANRTSKLQPHSLVSLESQSNKLQLKLECKSKLSEVSDVTFNELLVESQPEGGNKLTQLEPEQTRRRRRGRDLDSSGVRVTKSTTNQVTQTKSPATVSELRRWLLSDSLIGDACKLESLALQLEDPLIVEHLEQPQDEEQADKYLSKRQIDPEVIEPDNWLSVNCMTISTTLGMEMGDRKSLGSMGAFCGNSEWRRRSTISGKHSTNDSPLELHPRKLASSSHNRSKQVDGRESIKHQVALMALPSDRMTQLQVDLATGRQLESSTSSGLVDSAQSSRNQRQQQPSHHVAQLQAPPLLEWFINNQEAPAASARYFPELPTLPPPIIQKSSGSRAAKLQYKPRGGATETRPPIDYATYFANFVSRPLGQSLLLNLKPKRTHFMTRDSKLQLRCSSTQAQVLAFEVATVKILVVDESADLGHSGWIQRSQKPSGQGNKAPTNRKQSRNYLNPNPAKVFTVQRSQANTTASHRSRLLLVISSLAIATFLLFNLLTKYYAHL